jgi:hypothetical protein
MTLIAAKPFTTPYAPDPLRDNIFVDLLNPLPGSELLKHIALSMDSIWIAILGFLVAAIRGKRNLPEAWWALTLGLTLGLQPLLVSPRFPGFTYNEPRIAAIGLPVLSVALAMAWGCQKLGARGLVGVLGGLMLISVTRTIGWPTAPTPIALSLNAVGALVVVLVLFSTVPRDSGLSVTSGRP